MQQGRSALLETKFQWRKNFFEEVYQYCQFYLTLKLIYIKSQQVSIVLSFLLGTEHKIAKV